ncbi:hypothetical protein G9A89_002377, partial [Geosiphon pyriformis]
MVLYKERGKGQSFEKAGLLDEKEDIAPQALHSDTFKEGSCLFRKVYVENRGSKETLAFSCKSHRADYGGSE